MEDEDSEYQEVLQQNFYLFSKYLVPEDFFEQLISHNVLSIDDKGLITNHYVNQNRRQRANKFIEILMTKGKAGFEKFIELLEFTCPHVYKEVTKKEPRDPPPGFVRNRNSDQLYLTKDLPSLLEQIRDRYLENTELDAQLSALHGILQVSREENIALENEIEKLKTTQIQNKQLKEETMVLERKNKESLEDRMQWMQKVFELKEKCDDLEATNRELQAKNDDLNKQFNEHTRKGAASFSSSASLRSSAPTSRKPELPPKPRANAFQVQAHVERHIVAEKEILREEVDELSSQCEDIAQRLRVSEELVSKLEAQLRTCQKQEAKANKEIKLLHGKLKEAVSEKEQYFKTIQDNGREILRLESDKISEQHRAKALREDNQDLLKEKHRLQNELRDARHDLDMLKCQIRSSSSSVSIGSSGSDEDNNEESEMSNNISRLIKRRECVQKKYQGDKYASILEHQRQQKKLRSQEHVDEDDDCYKACTLPPKANDSPELLFQREIAHFRYSKHHQLQKMDSTAVNLSNSMIRKSDAYEDRAGGSRRESYTVPEITRREYAPTIPDRLTTQAPDDNGSDQASSVLVKRTPGEPRARVAMVLPSQEGFPMDDNHFGNLPDPIPYPGTSKNVVDAMHDQESRCVSVPDCQDLQNELLQDFPSHEVCTDLLPRDCSRVPKSGLDRYMSRFVTVRVPVLEDKLEVEGGNHTGIFISRLNKPSQDFAVGDQIKTILYRPVDRVEEVKAELKGCCLQCVHKLLSGDFVRRKKEGEVRLEIRTCKEEYELAQKWMLDNGGHGDYFYIRCNEPLFTKDNVTVKRGEIFLVRDSAVGEKVSTWKVYSVDPHSGEHADKAMFIPGKYRAQHLRAFSRSQSSDDVEETSNPAKSRNHAFRKRGEVYDIVLPMKASVKLPVYIIGPEGQLVSSFLRVIARKKAFVVDSGSDSGLGASTFDRKNDHLVKECHLEKLKAEKSTQRIIVFMNVTAVATADANRRQYGHEFSFEFSQQMISKCMAIKQKLVDSGHYFEELTLPAIQSSEDLVDKLKSRVRSAQDRVRWLSREELEASIATRYSRYLDYPLNDIQFKLQVAMSQDHSFDQGIKPLE